MKAEKNTSRSKFIVLGSRRTGSTYLQYLLDSHSKIKAFGELFDVHEFRERNDRHLPDFRGRMKRISKKRFQNPDNFFKHVLFSYFSEDIVVGFRLFYDHIENGIPELEPHHKHTHVSAEMIQCQERIITYIKKQPGIRIIHLKRKNMLNQFYSHERAKNTGQYSIRDTGDRARTDKIYIDQEKLQKFFSYISNMQAFFDSFFGHIPLLNLYYESLVENFQTESRRIQEFLDVEFEPLKSPLKKIVTGSMEDSIENYAFLKQYFIKSRWSQYFSD